MKNRTVADYLRILSKKPAGRILVFTGARQTGKTTLARALFPEYAFLAIEDPVLRGSYARLTAAQWCSLYPTAILDEVQKERKPHRERQIGVRPMARTPVPASRI
jgi:hypothetical protein